MDERWLSHDIAKNNIQRKCIDFMFARLIPVKVDSPTYSVIFSQLEKDGSWRVILETPLMPNHMYQFEYRVDRKYTEISTCIKAHALYRDNDEIW